MDRIVLLAVESSGSAPAINFNWLAQQGVAKPVDKARGLAVAFDSLLGAAVGGEGQRGMDSAERGGTSYVMRTVSWAVPIPAGE
jgi:hypothetical protein